MTEAVLLKDHFLRNGIEAALRGKSAVRVPYAGIPSEVWIAEDPDEGDAMGLIRDFLKRDSAPLAPKSAWECAHFREGNPGQFDVTFHTDLKRSGGDALESALAAASHIG